MATSPPWRPDRWLVGGVIAGSGLFLAAGFAFKHVPRPAAPPDFSDVRVVQGRLFCASYVGRRGSDFRIDGQDYVAPYRSCDLQRDGVSGPLVEARWVALAGPSPSRLVLSVRHVATGQWIHSITPQAVLRWQAERAQEDPFLLVRLYAAFAGVALVIASLARAHRQAAR